MTTLNELAAMLDKATGPSRELDTIIDNWKMDYEIQTTGKAMIGLVTQPYTSSIDASLALVERLLPDDKHGVQAHVYNQFGEAACKIGDHFNATFEAPTAPLAILRALVVALIAQENRDAQA